MIKKVGGDIISDMEKHIRLTVKEAESLSELFANLYFTRLKENISTNKFGFSLAANTLAKRKAKGNFSNIPLVDTGEYLKAIVIKKSVVTMRKGNHKGGFPYEELWSVLEYGRKDKSIPAFPIWRLTFEEIKPEFLTLLKNKYKAK